LKNQMKKYKAYCLCPGFKEISATRKNRIEKGTHEYHCNICNGKVSLRKSGTEKDATKKISVSDVMALITDDPKLKSDVTDLLSTLIKPNFLTDDEKKDKLNILVDLAVKMKIEGKSWAIVELELMRKARRFDIRWYPIYKNATRIFKEQYGGRVAK
jgi:hypothetical protein